eukprot:scaffold14642_cov146-Skeletonema_menzelii.AAC.5
MLDVGSSSLFVTHYSVAIDHATFSRVTYSRSHTVTLSHTQSHYVQSCSPLVTCHYAGSDMIRDNVAGKVQQDT